MPEKRRRRSMAMDRTRDIIFELDKLLLKSDIMYCTSTAVCPAALRFFTASCTALSQAGWDLNDPQLVVNPTFNFLNKIWREKSLDDPFILAFQEL